jgi:methylthioribose-1-phosphate isomerase
VRAGTDRGHVSMGRARTLDRAQHHDVDIKARCTAHSLASVEALSILSVTRGSRVDLRIISIRRVVTRPSCRGSRRGCYRIRPWYRRPDKTSPHPAVLPYRKTKRLP